MIEALHMGVSVSGDSSEPAGWLWQLMRTKWVAAVQLAEAAGCSKACCIGCEGFQADV